MYIINQLILLELLNAIEHSEEAFKDVVLCSKRTSHPHPNLHKPSLHRDS